MPLYVGSTAVQAIYVGTALATPEPPPEPNLSWTPAELQTSLHMWLDASEVSTLTLASGAVSQWSDRSGNSRHATQATATNRPATAILNRRVALSFDGSNDFFSLAAPLPNASSGSMSIFAIGAPVLATRDSMYAGAAAVLKQYPPGSDAAGSWFAGYDLNGRIGVTHHLTTGGNAAGGVRGPTGQIVSASPAMMYWQYDNAGGATSAARWGMRVNASAEVTETTADTSTGWGEANGEIGRSFASGSYHYRGLLAEIVVCNVALSTEDRQRVEGYLAHKWGIAASLPADHPHKAQPPQLAVTDPPLWSAVATDPYWNNVSLLLNFDGADNSTTFTDSGPNNLTASITRSGAAVISTAQSRFGGSSGLFSRDNYQSGLVMPSTPLLAPGSGPFTAECWVRYTAANQRPACPFKNPMYGPYTVGGYLESRGGYGGASNVGSLAVNEWSFVAICRDGADMRLYINGSLSATVSVGTGIVWPLELVGAGSMGEGQTPEALGGYLDDFRYTKGVCRYSGATSPVPTSAFSAPAVGEILFSLDLAIATTAYQGATTLAITASAYQSTVSGYQWQKRNAGSQAWQNVAGATTNSLSLSGLTDAANTGDSYRCVVTGPLGSVRSTETTLTVDESGINGDNRFRVIAPAATTSLTASAESTTGYWKMVSSSGQQSPVIGSPYSQYYMYYWLTGTVSGMPSGADKTVEIFSCDAAGNPSGELEYVSFAPSSQAITRVDASGCASLRGFRVSSNTAPSGSWSGNSVMPSAIESVRAVGVAGSGGFYSQFGNYPAIVQEGINVEGQQLNAAALNQLYTDLSTGTNSARVFVGGNPGTSGDDPTIATAKGYTVFGT